MLSLGPDCASAEVEKTTAAARRAILDEKRIQLLQLI
jgi:hypothetical protein